MAANSYDSRQYNRAIFKDKEPCVFKHFFQGDISYQLAVFIHYHLQARLVLEAFSSGSRGNNTAQVESKRSDSFRIGAQHLPSHLSCPYLRSCFRLAFCLFFTLLSYLSLSVSSVLPVAHYLHQLLATCMFCSPVFMPS